MKRIYAYTVVGKDNEPWERTKGQTLITGAGSIKVGETTRATARERVKEQLGTAYPSLDGVTILLDEPAVRADGTEFSDHDVHEVLVKNGIRRPGGEWFEASLDEVRSAINVVRWGRRFDPRRTESFGMRPEQQAAVKVTSDYFRRHSTDDGPLRFLWNAKMRFGKTFTSYQLAREMGWKRILVLTYKPAVASQWKDDLLGHVDFEDWSFIDRDSTADERDEASDSADPLVWFASFQDIGGRTDDGQIKLHNENIQLIDWDCVILDEYHFGAWRDSSRELYDPADEKKAQSEEPDDVIDAGDFADMSISTGHILYLSGTPFRAIQEGEFTEDAIYNWTYVDEQREKSEWDESRGENPYITLPAIEMYSYQMGQQASDYASDGEFDGFSLNEFFKSKKVDPSSRSTDVGAYVFTRPDDVHEFLAVLRGDLPDSMKSLILTGQKPPFPYSHRGFEDAVRHSVWYLNDVASCYAMRDMLNAHPYFRNFEVVVAAGNKAGQGAEAKPPVEAAIGMAEKKQNHGSITLTCGKLMTGVTIREWGAIFMLRSLKSPESYFQAAFRVQSPWAYRDAHGTLDVRKEVCYIFEFDPERALDLVAQYGHRIASKSGGTSEQAIGDLMNYLPIYAFSGGRMEKLDEVGVLDWATAGIGATALAARWNSPLLVQVDEITLGKVLTHPDLLETLDQIEDFRNLRENAQNVVTSTKLLKKAKREQGGKLTPDQNEQKKATNAQKKEIREKLQKFLANIPVFMYVTDHSESALIHVIESQDSALFERVTGLTVEDFKTLNDIGLFNPANMNDAIWKFRSFEQSSLRYVLTEDEWKEQKCSRIGLWDRTVRTSQLLPDL